MTGKRRVTSFDVARRAGVSRSVVSAVLNGTPGIGVGAETRQAVLEAIRELGYEVNAQARGMRTGVSHCIGVRGNTANPLFLQVLEGIQEVCVAGGYHVLLYGERDEASDERGLLNLYRQRRIDGIVTLDLAGESDERWAESVAQARAPYVSIEGYPENGTINSVVVDYRRSVRDALDYMRASGASLPEYVQFGFAGNEEPWAEKERREAYRTWMEEMGEKPSYARLAMGDGEALDRYVRLWSARGSRPALLLNWSAALDSLLRAADRVGHRVGRDFQLMALDNTLRVNRHLLPSIACMEIPYAEMGRLAARRLLAELTERPAVIGGPGGRTVCVAAELFRGESL